MPHTSIWRAVTTEKKAKQPGLELDQSACAPRIAGGVCHPGPVRVVDESEGLRRRRLKLRIIYIQVARQTIIITLLTAAAAEQTMLLVTASSDSHF